jgi:hypothetical protein
MKSVCPDDELPGVDPVPFLFPQNKVTQDNSQRKKKKKHEQERKDAHEVTEQEFNDGCIEVYDNGEHKRRICGNMHIIDRES